MTDHVRELRRYAPLLGRPTMMLAAADEIERLAAKLEAAEKSDAESLAMYRRARDECDALRAKIEQMEKQEPVAWMRDQWSPDCGNFWELNHDDEMGWRDRKDWVPLYALPGAQAQPAPGMPEVTDAMALAFHHALTDGSIGAREVEEIKDALRAALAAAPEAKP